ncbi:MAG: hypothetical protein WBW34_14160 [Nitrososphaeraceae archaeon]
MPERPDYENEKKEYYIYMRVEPVSFGKEHKEGKNVIIAVIKVYPASN